MIRALVIAALLAVMGDPAQSQNHDEGDISSLPLPGSITFAPPSRPEDTVLAFTNANKTVAVIRMNGSVEFGEGFTADDAAREFWKHLGRSMPNKCEAAK